MKYEHINELIDQIEININTQLTNKNTEEEKDILKQHLKVSFQRRMNSNKELEKVIESKLKKDKNLICEYCGISQSQIWESLWNRKNEDDICLHMGDGHKRCYGTFEIDHKDGKRNNDNKDNLAIVCPLCNNAKSNFFTAEQWKKLISKPTLEGKTFWEPWVENPRGF